MQLGTPRLSIRGYGGSDDNAVGFDKHPPKNAGSDSDMHPPLIRSSNAIIHPFVLTVQT